VLCLCALSAAPPPCADEADGKRVKVTVVVVFASEKGDKVDEQVQCIAREVQKRNPQLKSFRMGCMKKQSLAVDEKGTFKLCEGQTVDVVVKRPADEKKWVELAVTAPKQGELGYRVLCGKFFPIITRYETQNKERLILAVRVEPCHGR
jgi:hypothetical protein